MRASRSIPLPRRGDRSGAVKHCAHQNRHVEESTALCASTLTSCLFAGAESEGQAVSGQKQVGQRGFEAGINVAH